MGIGTYIKNNPTLKRISLWAMIPAHEQRPRRWISWFINPFFHRRGRGSIIRRHARLDVFPYQEFELGRYSVIEDFATINNGVGPVRIGDETIVGIGNVIIGPVTIGHHVMLAQHIVVSGLNHGYQDVLVPPSKQEVICKQITIDDSVWIGANSVITAGVTVGKHSIIGAGSVVTRDVPAYAVAVGNPARVVKQYDHQTKTWKKI